MVDTNPDGLLRWSGFAAIAGALLIAQSPFLHPAEGPAGLASPLWVPSHYALYIGYALVQLGLVGVLARQRRAAGRLGEVAFVLAFLGVGLTLMEGRDHTFNLPVLRAAGLQTGPSDDLPGLWALVLGAAFFSLGHVLLGAATFRAAVFPRAVGVLLAVGAPLLAFAPPIGVPAVAVAGGVLYGGGMLWLGWELLAFGAERRAAAARVAARA